MAVALVVAVLPALLVAAAVSDLMSYTIPNVIPAAMLLLFVAFIILIALAGHGMSWSETGLHLLAGTLGLIAGMIFFAFGWVGGGDAKLFAAAVLWLGWDALLDYALMASILGGALTLGLVFIRQLPLPVFLVKQAWFARLSDHKGDIPYGVALSLAALLVLPYAHVFEIASAT